MASLGQATAEEQDPLVGHVHGEGEGPVALLLDHLDGLLVAGGVDIPGDHGGPQPSKPEQEELRLDGDYVGPDVYQFWNFDTHPSFSYSKTILDNKN